MEPLKDFLARVKAFRDRNGYTPNIDTERLIRIAEAAGEEAELIRMPDDRWCRWCLEWMEDSEECAFCDRPTVAYSDLIDQAYERQVEKELLESARKHVITPDEHAAQVVSFVYGNLAIDDQTITRDEVKRQQEKELSDHE